MFLDAFPVLSETFILNQIAALLDDGHDLEIFALSKRELVTPHAIIDDYDLYDRVRYFTSKPATKPAAIRECVSAILSNRHQWIRPRGLAMLVRVCFRRPEQWGRMATFRIANQNLAALGYDVVHCQYGGLGVRVMPLVNSRILDGHLYVAIRGHDVTQRGRYTPEFYKDLFRTDAHFMPVSKSLQSELLRLGCAAENISIVRSGIECRKFVYSPREVRAGEPIRLISVGRLVEMKGFQYSIRALCRLHSLGYRVRYDIVGDGPLHEDLSELIESLGMQDWIGLRGALGHEELVRQLSASHIFVLPSVTASNGETEGIPNALKEAMAQGMPVVATSHGGVPELVKNGLSGNLIPEGDSEALALKLSEVIDDPGSWNAMGTAARHIVEDEYDNAVVLEALLACYMGTRGS